ncbi:hypothetical protein SERLA73DRAFT_127569 [Serpula lacrymans var. lacrymans S7.3]|uniref:Uncharacterized protein n=2 Tax=Serpula lacrymans var. lacrymans TaxID=341189 RepID=F8QH42_SERL3|nr:uncharacterized protein SERLADRAFT_467186 [Serpula lacrymans var. lacrymans S7.9]EGN92370.1 hypothetical protein SERLA73DRAFT_127569 [Serpula lacrymans var. lacrymans S7.3]EGO24231.1 hypothetical protein SERLADRAFT_467186 [Serpula lacrymans var. lacrymans S7.9]
MCFCSYAVMWFLFNSILTQDYCSYKFTIIGRSWGSTHPIIMRVQETMLCPVYNSFISSQSFTDN